MDGDGRSITVTLATQTPGVHWVVGSQYSPRSKFPVMTQRFYEKTAEIISKIPPSDHITLCGDYNGAVGNATSDPLQQEVVGKKNPSLVTLNGEKLIQLCIQFDLTLPQTFRDTGPDGGVTWLGNSMMRCKPRVYDYVVCRKRHRSWFSKIQVVHNWDGIRMPHYAVVAQIDSKYDRKDKHQPTKRMKQIKLEDRKPRVKLDSLSEEV